MNSDNVFQLKQYWPVLLIVAFFLYRFYNAGQSKKAMAALGNPKDIQFVDVRSEGEFSGFSIPGSHNIPSHKFKEGMKVLDKSKPVVVYCASGTRSIAPVAMLKKNGFSSVINGGGISNIQSFLNSKSED